jgi:arylsulfatase A-like enzyme
MRRRDFLKLSSLASSSAFMPQWIAPPRWESSQPVDNVLVLVFDAWSARNVSLFGYPRKTMPFLDQLAQKAVVYHNHHTGGPFTTPGTATLLTGLYPWTHRAFNANGLVTPAHSRHSFFSEFPQHYQIGYSHNNFAVSLLRQLGRAGLDELVPMREMMLGSDIIVSGLLDNDLDIAAIARVMTLSTTDFANSLLFPNLHKEFVDWAQRPYKQALAEEFPRGLPSTQDQIDYILEDGINWLVDKLPQLPAPFLGYFHFLPPHDPYVTRREFIDIFSGDDYLPFSKPDNPFSEGQAEGKMARERSHYDEFIAYVDAEFYRMYQTLGETGLWENTWLVVTSDHGEMFERGIVGHSTEYLSFPLTNIPLLIFPPGQQERVDVHAPTSAVDVLPTMLHVTGQPAPDWCEGMVLPPFGDGAGIEDRPVYTQHLRHNAPSRPTDHGSYSLIRGDYKLAYYRGWPQQQGMGEIVELYNLKDDPEELEDLSLREKDRTGYMLRQLKAGIERADDAFK